MSVCYECCVLLVRGLCDELISRLEESYGLWWVAVCDLEALIMRRPWPNGCFAPEKKQYRVNHTVIGHLRKIFSFLRRRSWESCWKVI